jgi:hypothetical protein
VDRQFHCGAILRASSGGGFNLHACLLMRPTAVQ